MTQEKPDPIQEQLIQARRNQILDAATKVFAEKGFQRATIRDVDKTALMLGILDRVNESERRDEDLSQMENMDVQAFAQHYLRRRFALMTQDGLDIFQVILSEVLVNSEMRTLYMEQIIEPTFALAEKYLARLVEQGKMQAVDVPLTLRVISGAFLGLILLRILGDPVLENQWDALPDLLTTLFTEAIKPS